MIKKVGYYYPFTIPGTVSFGLIMYLIGAGYTQKNPYALFLSFAGLLLLTILIVLTRIQAYRLGKEQLIWDASTAMYAAKEGGMERFYTGGFTAWFFFRVHVCLRGKLVLGDGVSFRVLREHSFTGEGALELPLDFPCTGTYVGEAVYSIKDVFGLVRARAGIPIARSIPVQPSLLPGEIPVHIQISGGEDDTQPRKSSDEEKYYQREYIPGDRFRDINWKATSRIGEMFTRISPVTEEQTKLVLVDFRHFSPELRFTRDHAAHIEYVKRWCVSFLWKVKNKQPEFQFIVHTGYGAFAVETSADVQRLSIGMSGLFFMHDPGLQKDLSGIGDVYVFTTPFDSSLKRALQEYSGKRVNIMTTAFQPRQKKAEMRQTEARQLTARQSNKQQPDSQQPEQQVFTVPFLRNGGMVHVPGSWILKSPGQPGGGRTRSGKQKTRQRQAGGGGSAGTAGYPGGAGSAGTAGSSGRAGTTGGAASVRRYVKGVLL